MRILFVVPALPTAMLSALLGGCGTAVNDIDVCESDDDCGAFRFCDPAGACRCRSDDACDASEFCNLAGSCQSQLQCFVDEDCRADTSGEDSIAAICDTRLPLDEARGVEDSVRSPTAGQCVTLNAIDKQCLLDSHCGFGAFCALGVCSPGCNDNADCRLGEPCIDGQCDATLGACNEVGYCDFGEVCGSDNTCAAHPEADILCQGCDPRPFEFGEPCPESCLIDTSIAPDPCTFDDDCGANKCFQGECKNFFCGSSSCDDDNPCPRGYSCRLLISVSGTSCTPDSGSSECGGTSVCLGGGENAQAGYCSCTSDPDCPAFGSVCTDPGPNGVCVIGSTCAPADGLLCADVLP
jgi:hypothetical protein